VQQALPPFDRQVSTVPPSGTLEVIIDERGRVEAAFIRQPIHPRYDPLVLEAASGWQYRPATLYGKPVKYRKLVGITVKR
jgi:hypothetical protein